MSKAVEIINVELWFCVSTIEMRRRCKRCTKNCASHFEHEGRNECLFLMGFNFKQSLQFQIHCMFINNCT